MLRKPPNVMFNEYILAFMALLTSVGFVSVPLKIRRVFTCSPGITLEQSVGRSVGLIKSSQTREEIYFPR